MNTDFHKLTGKGRNTYLTRKELQSRSEYNLLLKQLETGAMLRIKAGVYARPEILSEPVPDISKIVPEGILCLYSAWSHHQLSVQVPATICVAVKRGRKVKLPDYPKITLYRISIKHLHLGVIRTRVGKWKLPIYDLERSVCDALRYRNKIGIETSSEILRNYLNRSDRNLEKLHRYAKELRIDSLLSTYLQISL